MSVACWERTEKGKTRSSATNFLHIVYASVISSTENLNIFSQSASEQCYILGYKVTKVVACAQIRKQQCRSGLASLREHMRLFLYMARQLVSQ